jgi:hypothetical protein
MQQQEKAINEEANKDSGSDSNSDSPSPEADKGDK